MLNTKCLKSDIKQIMREPILLMFLIVPFLVFLITKLLIAYLYPVIMNKYQIDLNTYNQYLLVMMLLMTPNLLGTVFGFIMIDERDSKITDLMVVTPMGTAGYLINRMITPFMLTIVYTVIGYFIMGIYQVNISILILSGILLGLESVFFGTAIYKLSDDKVKALTYVKGLNIVILLAFVELTKINWLINISKIFPHYWIGQLLINNELANLQLIISTISVHLIWLVVYVTIIKKKGL